MTGAVLVTGASGGLGLSLVEALSAMGRKVIAIGRRQMDDPRLTAPGVTYRRVDLSGGRKDLITHDIETVFHCAALSTPWGRRQDFQIANVEATRHLLDAVEQAGVQTFVHVSTPSIYAAMRDQIGIIEDDEPEHAPLNHYAQTKLEAERLVLQANGSMRTVAIRPRGITGPDDSVVLPRLAALAGRRRIPLIRDGAALVEMIDVRDAVIALLAAERLIDDTNGYAFNVSGGQPLSVRQAATGLARAMGREPNFVGIPLAAAGIVANLVDRYWPENGSWGEPKLTRYALATLAYSQTFDLSRARQMLQWAPRHDAFETLFNQARRMA